RCLFTREIFDSPYVNKNSYGDTYGSHRNALEFGRDEYLELIGYAREIGITLFATAFDCNSADFLADLDMPAYKIASGDLNNIPLLKHVAGMGKPMLMSTGGGSMRDVERAYEAVAPINDQLCILQCLACYPAEAKDMNLSVISTFRERYPDVVVGLSDHQNGIAMALVGYVLGARVIEKHFTLNRAWKGTDHSFSLTPSGLKRLVRDLRRARLAMGDGVKEPMAEEAKALYKMGKKLVAAADIPARHILTEKDVAIKSPNDGLPPFELKNVLGKRLTRPLAMDENILFEDLED
ncbi:MAG: N-acetylneuraminate synthase family protein, partial [Thermodesulfobacteriota bacterium]|nr:N-acetylneuraminate synthase family protein [Thermodesulfobacteriota bacterium]